jgi:hypothetical protein
MAPLRLLPGEREHWRLHPAHIAFWPPIAWALLLAVDGALLWAAFHAGWWAGHEPGDWTAPWTWLWGNDAAAHVWSAAGLVAGGALSAVPRRTWRRLWGAAATALAVSAVAAVAPQPAVDAIPAAVMGAALPFLAWAEARRLATTYHVTNLRIVARASLPRRSEASVLVADIVDLDVRRAPWPDTGTLVPVLARPRDKDDAAPALGPRLSGVHPLARVKALVEALAKRSGAAGKGKEAEADAQVADALQALGAPAPPR